MFVDPVQTNVREKKAEIQKMIQARQRKMEEIKDSVDLSKVSSTLFYGFFIRDAGLAFFSSKLMFCHLNHQSITEREIMNSYQVCTTLINAINRHRADLVEELELRQEETERRAKDLNNELHQEISDLQTRNSELLHLELTQNPLHVLQVR